MAAKPGPKKKAGSTRRSGNAAKKDLLIGELNSRVAALESSVDLIKRMPMGVYEVDFRVPSFVSVNDYMCSRLGYTRDELLSMSPFSIIHEEDGQLFRERIKRQMAGEKLDSQVAYRVRTKDGRIIYSLLNVAFTYEDGRPKGALVIARDVTDRKQAEEALQESKAHMSSIFRAAPTGIGVVGDRVIKETNDRLCEITGYTREELLGKSARILYPSDEDYEYVGREKYRQITRKGTGTVETRWRRKDGRVIDILLSSTPLDPDNLKAGVTFTALDITERKRAEEALRESEEKFRLVADFTYDWESWIGPNGDYIYVSPSCERITGHRPEEFYRDPLQMQKIIHPDDREAYEHHKSLYLNREYCIEGLDFRIVEPSGETRWISHMCQPVFGSDGTWLGRRASNRDITERKLAEEALRESEERYKLVATGAHGAIWDWDVPNKRVFFSPRWKTLRGLSDDEVTNHEEEWSSRIHPEDAPRVMAAVRAHFEGRTPFFAEEYRTRRKDGSWLWISDRGMAQRDAAGRVVRMAGSENDISERKRAEEALRESREKYRELVENANSIILKADRDGNIIFFNEFAQRFFGYSEAEIIGRNALGTIVPTSDSTGSDLKAMLDDLLRHPEKYQTNTHQNMRKNGELVWVAWTNKAIYDDKGNPAGVFSIGNDITQLKRAEEELKDAKQQAELYLDLMAHDISNMHQIAMGYLEMAREVIPVDDAQKELLEMPMDMIERSAQLIRNVQKLQRGRTGEYKWSTYDLGELIDEVAMQFKEVPGKSVKITNALKKGIRVEANELIRDVFINLIGNAIKHSNGPVYITIWAVMDKDDRFCRIMIDDNGPGIPDKRKKAIFARSGTGESMTRGTGLGLYIVRTLVESYGGQVWVEDRVAGDYSKGARFVVMLIAVEK